MRNVGFVFGAPLAPEAFFDREEEVARTIRRVASLRRGGRGDVVLIGPRRVGKSSLLDFLAFKLSRQGFVTVKIDCEGLDFIGFLKAYGDEVIAASLSDRSFAESLKDRLRKGFTEAVAALSETLGRVKALELSASKEFLSLRIELERAGASRKLSDDEVRGLFEKTMALPELLGGAGKKFVVLFDEFQETKGFTLPASGGSTGGAGGFYANFRRVTQRQKNVCYVYTGSAIGMMEDVFGDPSNPLAGNADWVYFKPFSGAATRAFLNRGFKAAGKKISLEAVDSLFEETSGFPAYLNWVGLRAIDLSGGKKVVSDEIARQAFDEMLLPSSPVRQMIEKQLAKLGGSTRRVLRALAFGFSRPSDVAREAGVKNVYVYLERLRKYGVVEEKTAAGGVGGESSVRKSKEFALVDAVMTAFLRE